MKNNQAGLVSPQNLTKVLDDLKHEVKEEINCVAIGRIEAFDDSTMTAKVTLRRRRMVDGVATDYPPLSDCPVMVIGSDTCRLTGPILQGKECVVFFNDRDFDAWFTDGGVRAPNTPRMHSLSDGLVLVGVYSKAAAGKATTTFGAYDNTRMGLACGKRQMAVGPNGVFIVDALGNNLGGYLVGTGGLLDQLHAICLAIDALYVALGAPPSPPPLQAIETSLDIIENKLQGIFDI